MNWQHRARGSATIEIPKGRAFVYVAWGKTDGPPLYVGKSRSLVSRLGQHSEKSAWWPYAKRIEVYAFPTEKDALIAEAEAIAELRPEYNQLLRRGAPPTPRYLRRRWQPEYMDYGPEITTDEITEDQLAIIRAVQDRRSPAA